MKNLNKALGGEHYLRATVVLLIDVVISILSTLSVLLLVKFLNVGAADDSKFIGTWITGSACASVCVFLVTKTYRIVIRHSTIREFVRMVDAVVGKEILLAAIIAFTVLSSISYGVYVSMLLLDFFITLSALVLVRVVMLVVYDFLMASGKEESNVRESRPLKKLLVFGDKEKSISLVIRLRNSPHFEVVGFLSPDGLDGRTLRGLPIYSVKNESELRDLKKKLALNGILFSNTKDARTEKDRLIESATEIGLKLYIAPSIDELKEGGMMNAGVRNIKIEDLLGRTEINIELDEVSREFEGKTVMVTGAAGSIGSELCRQLAKMGIRKLIMFDNAETPLHTIRLEFEDKYKWVDFTPVVGDVRLPERLDHVFRSFRPDVVFHAAAYKHVPLMEENPCEAVLVNVAGSRNVADKCVEYGVSKMVMVSTDKAVNPTNIMGCTKRLAEIYVQSLGLAIQNGSHSGHTQFVTTRFGNVLGSNGSVIPRFKEQIASGGPVTVTHPEIRRFFMTIPEACRLVMEAVALASDTNIFAFDMGTPVKIVDLAERMIHLAGFEVGTDIAIEFTGLRPGEKLYEEVLTTEENTIPTAHERIFKAKVRESSYDLSRKVSSELERLAKEVAIPEMVRLMKRAVPEFKSKHSEFEKYDNENSEEENKN